VKVVLIDYGAGNTQSVRFALQRLGIEPVLTDDAATIQSADKVIFPGVGHAKAAMDVLNEKNLSVVIPQLKQPVLGICLGMQLMCKHSEEGDTKCLGIFKPTVTLFKPELKVPHTGWNTVTGNSFINPNSKLTTDPWFYFVHSYYVPVFESTALQCNYVNPFSAAIQRDNFYGVQFHPEKSGEAGEQLLKNFLSI
jgi:glutamine amidotransferase